MLRIAQKPLPIFCSSALRSKNVTPRAGSPINPMTGGATQLKNVAEARRNFMQRCRDTHNLDVWSRRRRRLQ
ncbi:MAG: hypothetical protein K1Y36_16185 [Blastocatellia bacterium]|nr:hypothetical protein [Blastocatellia bacterium]